MNINHYKTLQKIGKILVSDVSQNEVSDDSVFRTDFHQFTNDDLPNLRNRDSNNELFDLADNNGNVAFIYTKGTIYWGRSINDILATQLMHNVDIYNEPTLSGTYNIDDNSVKYDQDGPLNNSSELKKTFMFKLKTEVSPNKEKGPYMPNDDIDRSNSEIYDVKMH